MRKILGLAAVAFVAVSPAAAQASLTPAQKAKVVVTSKTTPVNVRLCKVVLAKKNGSYLRRGGKTVLAYKRDGKRHRDLCVTRHKRVAYPGGRSTPDNGVKHLYPGGYIDSWWGDQVTETDDGDHYAFVTGGNRGIIGEHYISDRYPGTIDENVFYVSRNRWAGGDIVCEYNDQVVGDNNSSFSVMVEPYCYNVQNGGVLATPNTEFNYGFGAGNFEDLEDQN